MTFLGWLECVDYQEVRCCCKIGFGSRGSSVRIRYSPQSATHELHMIFDILDNTKDSSRAISNEYEQIKAIKVKP